MKKEGTKICKHCQSEIPAGAKVCPNCRKKQGIKVWQIILILIVVIGILVAVFGGGEEDRKTEFKQNETATFEDVNYTVTKVEKNSGDDFDTPKSGHEYVVVTVKIENKSEGKIPYNPFDWQMENSKGQEEEVAFTTVDSDTALDSGDLAAGGTVEGTLVFEEPIGDTGLKLNYYSNILYDEEATFKIKID